MNRDRPGRHMGVGAFNLVRATDYRACGGYEALRLTVVDDLKLGLLLHRAGTRTRAYIGGDDVACHWGTTVRGMIQLTEKNYFAIFEFRLLPIVAAGAGLLFIGCAALAGTFSGTLAGAGGLAFWAPCVPAAVCASGCVGDCAPAR